jgi:hypothetical protein
VATGLTISSTSNLSTGQGILIAEAKKAFEPAAPNPDLISSRRIPTGTKQWEIGTYARLSSASALTEGIDLAVTQQLVANYLTITPSEHGILATISMRLQRRQGDEDVMKGAGMMLGNSLRRRMDLDVIALYDGFSKTTPGASTALDISHFRGAVAYLQTDNNSSYGPAPMPLVAALHAEQISDIVGDIATDSGSYAAGLSADMVQNWWRGRDRLHGVQIFQAGNITRDSGDDAKGAIFSKEALFMGIGNEAEATEQPDHSLRAIEEGVFQEWGEGERADPHGVEIFSDAAATI